MSDGSPGFSEAWRWQGWTDTEEICTSSAVDGDGHFILAGFSYTLGIDFSSDTFTSDVAGDLSATELDGSTGALLWTWTGTSSGDEAGWISSVDIQMTPMMS